MTDSTATDRLRLVLRANAVTSGLGGLAGALGAGFFSDWMGIDHVLVTVGVSIGLVVFAVDVALAAASDERALRWAPWISCADLAWVAATIAVVASGALSTAGNVVAIIVGLAVADFAVLQLWCRRRALATGPGRLATAA